MGQQAAGLERPQCDQQELGGGQALEGVAQGGGEVAIALSAHTHRDVALGDVARRGPWQCWEDSMNSEAFATSVIPLVHDLSCSIPTRNPPAHTHTQTPTPQTQEEPWMCPPKLCSPVLRGWQGSPGCWGVAEDGGGRG